MQVLCNSKFGTSLCPQLENIINEEAFCTRTLLLLFSTFSFHKSMSMLFTEVIELLSEDHVCLFALNNFY